MTDAIVAARDAEEDRRAKARTTFLTSQRALTLINRELDSLSATVLNLCETPGTLPMGVAAEVRRTPDRYTVQIGPVGLSFSWIRGRSNSIADGQLLVIEWSGQLGDQRAAGGTADGDAGARERAAAARHEPGRLAVAADRSRSVLLHDARPGRTVRGVGGATAAGPGAGRHQRQLTA